MLYELHVLFKYIEDYCIVQWNKKNNKNYKLSCFLGPLFYFTNGMRTPCHMDILCAMNFCFFIEGLQDRIVAIWTIFKRANYAHINATISKYAGKDEGLIYYGQKENLERDKLHGIESKFFFFTDNFLIKHFANMYTTVEQKLGETVVIPCGCAHQLENFGYSLKVATDFALRRCLPHLIELATLNKECNDKINPLLLRINGHT